MVETAKPRSKYHLKYKGNPHGGYRKWLRTRHQVRKSIARF